MKARLEVRSDTVRSFVCNVLYDTVIHSERTVQCVIPWYMLYAQLLQYSIEVTVTGHLK